MIVKRTGGYGVRIWDRKTKRRRWLGTFPTLKEARRAEAAATLRTPRDSPLTVAQWAVMWLSDYARPARATQRTYTYATHTISRELGSLLLSEVDRTTARRHAHRWPHGTSRVARTMFADAMRADLIPTNPFSQLRLETPRGRRDLDALTEPEIVELADLAFNVHDDYGLEARAVVLTLGFVGVRPGELCALRRADLDIERGEGVVRYNIDASGKEKAPKSGRERIVVAPPPALDAVAHVEAHPDGLMFHSPRGQRLTKGNLSYLWRQINAAWKAKHGRKVTPHELRHACATLLLERGLTPADVAQQLGHQDGGRLVSVLYGHPDEGRARERMRFAFSDLGSRDPSEVVTQGDAP